jgi:hypothetical protein
MRIRSASLDPILPDFLAERRPADAEHLGGGSLVSPTSFIRTRRATEGLDEPREPLVERRLGIFAVAREGILTRPAGNLLLDVVDARRPCPARRDRGKMLGSDRPASGDDRRPARMIGGEIFATTGQEVAARRARQPGSNELMSCLVVACGITGSRNGLCLGR